MEESTIPVTRRITTVQVVAEKKSRSARELRRIARRSEKVTKAADGLDHIDSKLLADTTDENLNRVGIPIEVLVIEMLDQFAARNHPARVVHQIREQPIFMRRELHRIAIDCHPSGAGIEPNRSAVEFAFGVTG